MISLLHERGDFCKLIRRTYIAVIVMFTSSVAATTNELTSLPDWFLTSHQYKIVPYLKAAVALQAMGEKKACETLLEYASDHGRIQKVSDLRDSEQLRQMIARQNVIILCRMLFVAKLDGQFRRPKIGAPHHLLGDTGSLAWPLEPIEIVDGVPFLIATGYLGLGGNPELPESYVNYCITNCAWNAYQFKTKNERDIHSAYLKLLSSSKWKRELHRDEIDFLRDQM